MHSAQHKGRIYPTEDQEAIAFAEMLRLKKLRFSHIVNEAQTKNWGAINKARRMGKAKGVPDYLIVKGRELIFVELKRTKGGVVSEEQKQWIEALNRVEGVRAGICRGAEEAMRFVKNQ